MKVSVFTLGCKVNRYESDVMIGALLKAGYDATDKLVAADAYILNTCAVTREAERKSRQLISRARAKNPDARIYVCGCASEKAAEYFSGLGVDGVFGTADKFDVLKIFGATPAEPVTGRRQAYINVQDGCDNFCAYCVIPYLRGRSRSRSVAEIAKEVENQARLGKEIVLTGINTAAYGKDIGTDLETLILSLKDIDAPVSIGSFYADGICDGLLNALKTLKKFHPHFHLSLQSGDDGVLKSMGRHYGTAEFMAAVEKIRAAFPSAVLTADVIVGFPTETDESHLRSLEFIKACRFSDIHVFVFSKREGTAAWNMQSLPAEVVEKRRRDYAELKDKLRENSIKGALK